MRRFIDRFRAAMLGGCVLMAAAIGVVVADAVEPSPNKPPHIVIMIGEPEYDTPVTLPEFAKSELETRGLRCTIALENPADANDYPGLSALADADLLLISVRRHTPTKPQMALIKAHFAAGKPMVGIRTASHAFGADAKDDRHEGWKTLDQEVWGGSYQGHYDDVPAALTVAPGAADHAVLAGVDLAQLTTRKLYKNASLGAGCTPLLLGQSQGQATIDNAAWVRTDGKHRAFYTSLGTPADFKQPAYRRLLANGIFWALDRPLPPEAGK